MKLKDIRNIHLYLGCFFTPLLVLFLVTGCWQTYDLHQSSKLPGGYQSPQIIQSFSEIHINQRWADQHSRPQPSVIFRYLVLLMSLGLAATTVLGIVMAFKYTRPWAVWGCLFMGGSIPVILLCLARGFK
jgi:hypothetical protein